MTYNINNFVDKHEIISHILQEVDLGLAADVGTLQRFPKIVGNDSLCRELAYTARRFYAAEAQSMGFVRYSYKLVKGYNHF